MKKLRVLVVPTRRDPAAGHRLAQALHASGTCDAPQGVHVADPFDSGGSAAETLDSDPIRRWGPQVIAVCLSPETVSGARAFLDAAVDRHPRVPILLAGRALEPDSLCELTDRGAADFVLEPFSIPDLTARLVRLGRSIRGEASGVDEAVGSVPLPNMLGENPAWLREVRRIPQYAQCQASVLILGETGTGKELCARAIHQLSPRRAKPFAPINCGAIPSELVENELFGHSRGAFTGATAASAGIVASAEGGTLFLDEVDALPPSTQIKLLRFLQFREFRAVGSAELRHADVRVVAASNAQLPEAVRAGRFRADLYYRLNVLQLRLPPLRQRSEDVPLLALHLLRRFALEHGKSLRAFTPAALRKLAVHRWPGNVRELENVIERAVLVAGGPWLDAPEIVISDDDEDVDAAPASFKSEKARAIQQFERCYLQQVLAACDGNISRAARAAQKNRRAFWELLKKHRLGKGFLPPGLKSSGTHEGAALR